MRRSHGLRAIVAVFVQGFPTSIPDVLDVHLERGALAEPGSRPDLLIEVPHGATRTTDYLTYASRLTSPLPAHLVDFFHVNTDVGAPELALGIAARFVAEQPTHTVAVLRSRVPRTFIDCNRQMDATLAEFTAGKVTPGLMPWITSSEDRAWLRAAYDQYVAAVAAAAAQIASTGAMLMLHSYAPRTVDVEVDDQIVTSLRRAYEPATLATWPLRPPVDLISRALDGTDHAPIGVAGTLRDALAKIGIEVASSATYPLHPSTLAWAHVMARPGRALCVEVRRDLLAETFEPFAQMTIGPAQLDRLVGPFVTALRRWW